ncbi:MAG: Uma2 family endonuclease [Verrucomicrobia subdivision 3 bacterium]|nr:Uma2 family endonuclease [Limisphaerales bacterium]
MGLAAKRAGWISPQEYIEGEWQSEIRHEYVDGLVYAMAGASIEHNRISGNIFTALRIGLRGGPCEVFMADVKVKIPPRVANAFYYPDVLVACDPTEEAEYYRERPSIIFEVLSPDTERTDRREKAIAYRQIPSIRMYVIVEQERPAVTVLQPAQEGWDSEALEGLHAVLRLPPIGLEMTLATIYEGTAMVRNISQSR